MVSRWPIKIKLALCLGGLCVIILMLSVMVLRSAYAYRELAHTVSIRAQEGPLSVELLQISGRLRTTIGMFHQPANTFPGRPVRDHDQLRAQYSEDLQKAQVVLGKYEKLLESQSNDGQLLAGNREERITLAKIRALVARLDTDDRHRGDAMLEPLDSLRLESDLREFDELAAELPSHLQKRMREFRNSIQGAYRGWIILSYTAMVCAFGLAPLLLWGFYRWIQQPLSVLIEGSRRVAKNDFAHRIHLQSSDEMAELAGAMNAMIDNFQKTRDDLDRQVRERTAEVVRSERLASVGFLAAGVAHEINNPLASIAWAAEALESRLTEMWTDQPEAAPPEEERVVLKKYLGRLQSEAFRCKGITERLLDFSRMGDVEKHDTQLYNLVEDVIDMVKHLGKYREKKIEFQGDRTVTAQVNSQEIKQVVLNLITNGLDSLDPGGTVVLDLRKTSESAELVVSDNGCGMNDEVLKHLFEPFFTRRRDGSGTGLGLSITHRIVVDDHGGRIEATSPGAGQGSRFRVTLPLKSQNLNSQKQHETRRQAA